MSKQHSKNNSQKTTSLGKILTLNYGKNLIASERQKGQYPVYGSNGIVGYHNQAIINTPGIVVGRKGTVGSVHYSETPFNPIDTTYYITQEDTPLYLPYLFYVLKHKNLSTLKADVGVPGLNRSVAYNEGVLITEDDNEQKNIVYILSTLQKAIQKQEEIVNTTTAIKKSLLNKLFTEGTKGEQQKQTDIGLIPKSWEVVPLGKYIKFFGGFAFKSSETVKPGTSKIQLVRMGNLYQNKLDLTRSPTFYPDDYAEKYSRYVLKAGDLIISLTGTMGKEDYGFTVQIPEVETKLLLNQRVAKLIIDEEHLDQDFVRCYMLSRKFLDELYPTAQGTKQANLSTNVIQKIPFLVPGKDEQKTIAKTVMSIEKKFATNEKKRNIYENLFKTLLHELITGSLRVHKFNFN